MRTNRKQISYMILMGMTLIASNILGVAGAQELPPKANKQPHVMTEHGNERVDNYFWLKNRESQAVLDYLNAENAYTQKVMAETKQLEERLFEETKARIKQDDTSVPFMDRGYLYYRRYETGKEYPIYCRKKGGESGTEEITLNVNRIAEGHEFCRVSGLDVSSGNDILAYAEDFVGRRIYTLCFRNLTDGTTLSDRIPNVTGNVAWAEDNKTIFYARQDPETLRSYQIWRHEVGTPVKDDVLVYEEDDDTFSCYIRNSRSRKYLFIYCDQTMGTEVRLLASADPTGKFEVFLERERGHEYSVDHLGSHFFIRSNRDAVNFKLMRAEEGDQDESKWMEVIPHRENAYLSDFELFTDFLVVDERRDALTHIQVKPLNSDGSVESGHYIDFEEDAYMAYSSPTPDPNTRLLRYGYTSMTTPRSEFEYDMRTREKKLLKESEVLGGFDKSNYRTERVWAIARDGTKVPVSVVYHKDTPIDGSAPCLQYGYGSYGSSIDPSFNSSRLNLLDRGFVFAVAHIRGGQELGRKWYEDGKLLRKKSTFTDFVDVGRFLIEKKYADPKRLYARGGSAGGLLMGAVMNMAPELYHGIVADVPFVDVVTTMLDDSIPLTTSEYDEWGNPNDKKFYEYMLSYSPYDNIEAREYPNLLVTTGLHDSQVQYWEPAKWVAKLREMKTDDNLLLLKTNMDAGHGGASGRFKRFREVAFRHAFLLRLAGISE